MIQKDVLLRDLQKLLVELQDDLRERVGEQETLDARLREQHAGARQAGRTAQVYEEWREEQLTQAAVAWILACVFVRFMEDNGLVETPRLSGPGARLKLARDHHTVYFQKHPSETDREYLYSVFREVAELPAARELCDERHSPLWSLGLSGDGAGKLLAFWQEVQPETGALVHDFTDPEWNTRFLGDLYQDLSEAARKKYALLQTPEFVEEFILNRTLTPAIEEFGYRDVRLIDPTCGSGHFLLGAFRRLFELWQRHEPAANPRELAQRALDAVCGVDLNPYAVAIARFRLLLVALKASGVTRLRDAPGFRINLAAGDSLLHGKRWLIGTSQEAGMKAQRRLIGGDRLEHHYAAEDQGALDRLLGRQYHAVVGNPPYITVKDRALNDAYRKQYASCYMKYSLAVPFMERIFELAVPRATPLASVAERDRASGNPAAIPEAESDGVKAPAGYVGMITANSFMKREFGKKLIEEFIPRWDLTHVIDTSGAYIPGHGTPTVILFGRHQSPVSDTVRAVMGIRGEPTTPGDPARGLVWTAIVNQLDRSGSESPYVSVADAPRSSFEKHPWSLGGGGAAELKELLEERAGQRLADVVESIGFMAITGEDDLFVLDARMAAVRRLPTRPFVVGDIVRDWSIASDAKVIFPYDETSHGVPALGLVDGSNLSLDRFLWAFRVQLAQRSMFGKTPSEHGLHWYEYLQFIRPRVTASRLIAFAFVATHNHFVLDRGGKVFKQSAPVIKLPKDATEDEHIALLGLLNSSTASFWTRQTLFDKGGGGIGGGLATEVWEKFLEHDGTKLRAFPLAESRPLDLAKHLDELQKQLSSNSVGAVVGSTVPSSEALATARLASESMRAAMVALQEELDWKCYYLYGLIDDDLTAPRDRMPSLTLGERAFEIILARRMAAGDVRTTWFERHGSTPITEVPAQWPEDYRRLVERRIAMIEANPDIRLIEQPEYKRRWNTEPWEEQQQRALRSWLLDRLESPTHWPEVQLQSCARLADRAHADAGFIQVAALYRGRDDFDVTALVTELVEAEAVPFLPVLRYKESGQRKRALWERTWDLQRKEDAIDARENVVEGHADRLTPEAAKHLKALEVGDIPVPPKYTSADFVKGGFWRLRGKLDVPKERFVSYPHCERDADATLLVGWAGWDHLQQAQALAAYYVAMKDTDGWPPERLAPLLAGLVELQPWLDQWHNALDVAYAMGLGDYFRGFVDGQARELGLTTDTVRAWKPIDKARRGRKKATGH